MLPASPLPSYLLGRYRGWRATTFAENRSWYRHLAEQGQHPRAMIIACCDSRIHVTSIFGADSGEFFIHRNIANLVPPFAPTGDRHGTSAAIEYAVTVLRVAHIVVVGHSDCGGIAGCHDMCAGLAPHLARETSFIGRWMDILAPAMARLSAPETDRAARLAELGHLAVIVSLENLVTFPFVAEAVAGGRLTLHGASLDIASGILSVYDAPSGEFRPLT